MRRPLLALAAALALLSVGCAGPRAKTEFVQQAQRLHDASLAPAMTHDADLSLYVQMVGERLVEAARAAAPDKASEPLLSKVRFHLVNAAVPNVFSTGGTHVYVYSGLLRNRVCDTEEELAAVMAHGLAHVLNLDVQNTLGKADPRTPPAGVAWQFVTNRFSAQQEWAADKLAYAIYVRAGYDPELYGNVYAKLSDLYPGPAAVDRAPLSIRPEVARVSGVEPQRKWRKAPVADRRTFLDLKRQSQSQASVGVPSTNPAQAQEAQVFLWAFPNCILPFDLPDQQRAQEILRPRPPTTPPIEPN
jgi:hypothetical protein